MTAEAHVGSASTEDSSDQNPVPQHIAIIGGGIAGLFCAYVLAREGHNIELFEASDIFGGRIRSVRLKDSELDQLEKDGDKGCNPIAKQATLVNALDPKEYKAPDHEKRFWDHMEFLAEFGPMRIELEVQVLLHMVLDHLGIKAAHAPLPSPQQQDIDPLDLARLQAFPPFSSPASIGDPAYDLKPEEEGKNPLELLKLGLCRAVVDFQLDTKSDEHPHAIAIDEDDGELWKVFTKKHQKLTGSLATST